MHIVQTRALALAAALTALTLSAAAQEPPAPYRPPELHADVTMTRVALDHARAAREDFTRRTAGLGDHIAALEDAPGAAALREQIALGARARCHAQGAGAERAAAARARARIDAEIALHAHDLDQRVAELEGLIADNNKHPPDPARAAHTLAALRVHFAAAEARAALTRLNLLDHSADMGAFAAHMQRLFALRAERTPLHARLAELEMRVHHPMVSTLRCEVRALNAAIAAESRALLAEADAEIALLQAQIAAEAGSRR